MSYDLSRRSDRRRSNGIAGAHDRQVPVLAHEGSYRKILRRHDAECSKPNQINADRLRLHALTFQLLTDERTLMAAMDDLSQDGPKAPGQNGIRLHDLDRHQRWDLARSLRDTLRSGNYRRGRTRRIEIPKGNGKPGTRTLEIPNIEDQVVQKAVVLALQPLLDPNFDNRSFGFRPHRGREDALATAQVLAQTGGYQVLLLEDLQDAFTTVPHQRLLQVLRHHGVPEDTVELVRRCIGNNRNRGLPQGGSLSPLLLNVYLDHHLDRAWRRRMTQSPLIRYADDHCVLCRSREDAELAYATLRQLIQPTGMRWKGSPETVIHDLRLPDARANWLGYQLTYQNGNIIPQLAEESWTCLEEYLQRAHEEPLSSVTAYDTICGWVDQLGICLPRENLLCVYERIVEMSRRNGFEELPSMEVLETIRDRAVRRFNEVLQVTLYGVQDGFAVGSAHRHCDAASTGRTNGAPDGAGTIQTRRSAGITPAGLQIWADGACLPQQRCGGWAFIVENRSLNQPRISRSGAVEGTTNNRMELTAVIEALRSLSGRQQVRLFTDSTYVSRGIEEHLAVWRRSRWRNRGGGRLRNLDLWMDLDQLLRRHDVQCEWIRGHAGNHNNEECDRMAAAAAASILPRSAWPWICPREGGVITMA